MTPSEYRELIFVAQFQRDQLLALVAQSPWHQRQAALMLRQAVARLQEARCRRYNKQDKVRAVNLLAECQALLKKKQQEFDAADGAWQRLAFGADYC